MASIILKGFCTAGYTLWYSGETCIKAKAQDKVNCKKKIIIISNSNTEYVYIYIWISKNSDDYTKQKKKCILKIIIITLVSH